MYWLSLLLWLPLPALADIGRGSEGLQQMLVVGLFILFSAIVFAGWQVRKRQIAERPVRILVFAAWFWIWVFAVTLVFALINAWLAS